MRKHGLKLEYKCSVSDCSGQPQIVTAFAGFD